MNTSTSNLDTTSVSDVIPQQGNSREISLQSCKKRKRCSSIGRRFVKRRKDKMRRPSRSSNSNSSAVATPSSSGPPQPPPLSPPHQSNSLSFPPSPNSTPTTIQSSSNATTLSLSPTPQPPQVATPIQRGPKGKRMSVDQAYKLRIAIEMIFRLKYYKTYSPERLNGTNGIVHSICCDLGYSHPTTVRKVVIDVYTAIEEEKEYCALKKKFELECIRKIQKQSMLCFTPSMNSNLLDSHQSIMPSIYAILKE